jgi:protein ImuB
MFHWRRQLHRVSQAQGPERIAPEWWRDEAPPGEDRSHLTRDYYRIEDTDGRRFWLYREGLYALPTMPDTAPPPPRAPRWFLHGVFA